MPENRPLNVLVASDRSGTRAVIRQALGGAEFGELSECHSADEILPRLRAAAVSRGRIDVVLIGHFAAGGGLDLVRAISAAADVGGPKLQIIVIGAANPPSLPQDAIEAGAIAFVAEPIRPAELHGALAAAAEIADAFAQPEIDVMIVEDTDSNRTIIRHFLKALPARRIIEAADGVAALRMLRALSERKAFPHVLIVDYMMEPMDGLALVREIRASTELADPDVPILILTFKGDRETVAASQAAGADGFVVKPVAGAALISRVKRALAKPRRTRDGAEKPRSTSLMDRYRQSRQETVEIEILDEDPD